MIVYCDILEKLAEAGWSSYRIAKEKKIGNGSLQRIRKGQSISTETLNTICSICNCQPGDLLRYEPDKQES